MATAQSSSLSGTPGIAGLAVSSDIRPMEARLAAELPSEDGWQYEPKWDGFRCLAFRAGDEVEIFAKSGKSLSRYFPDMVEAIRALPITAFVLDGELTIPVGQSLSFEALQLRLHPAASRIRTLTQENPSLLILFDCLMGEDGASLVGAPLRHRRQVLERLYRKIGREGRFRLTPITQDRAEARAWLGRAGGALDGVIAKRLDGPYAPGKREMLKIKLLRTADCVVGGFRYESDSRLVGSLLLGLYDLEGKLNHVGFTSAISNAERADLTRRLEARIEPPGFTGAAPGGPSRWSTERSGHWQPLRPDLVVEVRYDHISGGRLRHGAGLVRWRPDKEPSQCRMDQLQAEARPAELIARAIA
ncbi:MAG TPA: ATP-dependent DNA ligase [Caulobacteraceae bacterium]